MGTRAPCPPDRRPQRAPRGPVPHLGSEVGVLGERLHHAAHVGGRDDVLHQLGVLRDLLEQGLHLRAVEHTYGEDKRDQTGGQGSRWTPEAASVCLGAEGLGARGVVQVCPGSKGISPCGGLAPSLPICSKDRPVGDWDRFLPLWAVPATSSDKIRRGKGRTKHHQGQGSPSSS